MGIRPRGLGHTRFPSQKRVGNRPPALASAAGCVMAIRWLGTRWLGTHAFPVSKTRTKTTLCARKCGVLWYGDSGDDKRRPYDGGTYPAGRSWFSLARNLRICSVRNWRACGSTIERWCSLMSMVCRCCHSRQALADTLAKTSSPAGPGSGGASRPGNSSPYFRQNTVRDTI